MFNDQASLLKLKEVLDTKFGAGIWHKYEVETLSLELNQVFSPLLLDKIHLLRVFETSPHQVYEDPALFLYAAEVVNNHGADFDVVPYLTILEAGYTLFVFNNLLKMNKVNPVYTEGLKKACAYILNHEGASENIAPFEFVPKEELSPGQTEEDTKNKELAIKTYIKHMESFPLEVTP